jgi:hypothetical protein
MTDEQDDATAEYMAGLLLEQDEDYNQELIPMGEIKTEDTSGASTTVETGTENAEDAEDVNTPDSSDTSDAVQDNGTDQPDTQADYTLSELFGAKNFDIEYSSFKLSVSYPEDLEKTYFSVSSREGHQLLIIKFSIKNKSGKDQVINLSEEKISYQLDINGVTINKPMFTILENDLQYIDMKMKGKATTEALLIYEISNSEDTANMNLIISKDNKTKIIEIK